MTKEIIINIAAAEDSMSQTLYALTNEGNIYRCYRDSSCSWKWQSKPLPPLPTKEEPTDDYSRKGPAL